MLYPGLNIIGGAQPRGSKVLMLPAMSDMLESLDIEGMLDMDAIAIEDMADIDEIDIEGIVDIDAMGMVIDCMSMLIPSVEGAICLLAIPDIAIVIDELTEIGSPLAEPSRPSDGPA
jgi:hypothetical protein